MRLFAPLIKKPEKKRIKPKNNSFYLYINRSGVISSVSKSFVDIVGHKKNTLIGKSIKTIIFSKHVSSIINIVQSLTETNPFYKTKTKIIDANGNFHDVELYLSLTSLEKNTSVFVIFRLSGTHIEMYNHLFEKKEQLKILSENTNHVEILLDPLLKCLYVSPSCEKLIGYQYSELVHKDLYQYIHPDDFELIWETFNLHNNTVELTIHFRLKHKTNGYVVVEGRMKKIYDKFNSLTNFAFYVNDATHQKRYQEKLISAKDKANEANNLKTNFLASISHEFRTPLNVIIGYSKILSSANTDVKNHQYIKQIENSGLKLLDMVDNILSYSLIEQNKFNINQRNICLDDFFKKLNLKLNSEISRAKKTHLEIRCDIVIDDTNLTFNVDEGVLQRIMHNILNNALKFTSQGYIRYGCRHYDENHLLFYVSDSGIGIPAQYHQMIFEHFTQQDGSLTKQYEGTGIGLAVTKKMIECLNGKIWLESEEGKGSSFYFILPTH